MKKISLLFLGVLLTACLSPVNNASKNNYVLNTVPEMSRPAVANSKVLLVSVPRMDAVMNNNDMVYLDGWHQVGYFSRNRWAAPPNDMLLSLLITTLQRQGGFRAVVAVPYSGQSDLRLDVVNFSVIQDFTTRPSMVRVKMDLILSDLRQQSILKTRAIAANIATTQDTPEGGVVAANQALAQCLTQIVSFANS